MHSALAFLALPAALGLTLASCTSNTQSCKNGACEIDLHGKGASDTLGGDGGSVLELQSASGSTAKVLLGGKALTLTVGQPVTLDNGTLLLEEVEGEDDIQLRVTASTSGSSPSGDASSAAGTTP